MFSLLLFGSNNLKYIVWNFAPTMTLHKNAQSI